MTSMYLDLCSSISILIFLEDDYFKFLFVFICVPVNFSFDLSVLYISENVSDTMKCVKYYNSFTIALELQFLSKEVAFVLLRLN